MLWFGPFQENMMANENPMKVIKVDNECDTTEVTLQVPEFKNFGQRVGELERLSFEAGEANPPDPAEIAASTAKLNAIAQGSREKLEKKAEAMADGPQKQMLKSMLEMMDQLTKSLSEAQPDEEEPEADPEEDDSFQYDLQRIRVLIPEGMKWDKTTRAVIEGFFAGWPEIRPAVLQATFKYYKKSYPEIAKFLRGSPGLEIILPRPSSPEAVADLFFITSIYLHGNGAIGLGCHCTWDEEHGYGVLIKQNRVAAVGEESEAFI
jgi:hypothetical protein